MDFGILGKTGYFFNPTPAVFAKHGPYIYVIQRTMSVARYVFNKLSFLILFVIDFLASVCLVQTRHNSYPHFLIAKTLYNHKDC